MLKQSLNLLPGCAGIEPKHFREVFPVTNIVNLARFISKTNACFESDETFLVTVY